MHINQVVEETKLLARIDRQIKRKAKKEKKGSKNLLDPISHNCCNAPLINRFKANVTDSFMVLMPLMYIVFYIVMGSREDFAQNKLLGWLYIMIPHFIIIVGFWYYKAQTPGLKAYELSIIDASTCQKATLISLINRYTFTFLSIIFILPMFIPFFNKKRKTLQDIVSNTCIKITPNKTK